MMELFNCRSYSHPVGIVNLFKQFFSEDFIASDGFKKKIQAFFRWGAAPSRLNGGQYPNYRAVIPKENSTRFTLSNADFSLALI
ncbi:hypothetical protein IPJ72_00015 [Candidatus Peregrinibacteria bacterium]|nr:MAG: hypothetical protein IPJ72_00015 [Candidatus Peregrinibacteria bacterium]